MPDEAVPVPASPSPLRLARHALLYGMVGGVICGVWLMIDYGLGFQTERTEIGRWTSLLTMGIPIAVVILGLMAWRNKALGGRIRFVQAFALALAIGLIYAAAMGGIAWLHAAKVAPDLIEKKIDHQALLAAQRPEAKPEEIALQAEIAKKSTTSFDYAKGVFSFSLMLSLFVGLIASITVPKRRPGLE